MNLQLERPIAEFEWKTFAICVCVCMRACWARARAHGRVIVRARAWYLVGPNTLSPCLFGYY